MDYSNQIFFRFEDREPTVIEFLREARERKQQTLNQNRREIRNDFEQSKAHYALAQALTNSKNYFT
jgi:hypothetical protein